MNTYMMLNDKSWGVRAKGHIPGVGDKVIVNKKNGTSKYETISKVLWQGNDDDGTLVAICTIVPSWAGPGQAARSLPHRPAPKKQGGCSCRDCEYCSPKCLCSQTCNCRGGNIYDC